MVHNKNFFQESSVAGVGLNVMGDCRLVLRGVEVKMSTEMSGFVINGKF